MHVKTMKFRKQSIAVATALALAGLSLTGCVVYPAGYGYGGGYGGGYYPAPAYYAPPVSFSFGYGGGWGGGYGHRWR